MTITFDIPDVETASQVVKAILNESYEWELKQHHFKEQRNKVEDSTSSELRKMHSLDYYNRRIDECGKMRDTLYSISMNIKEEIPE